MVVTHCSLYAWVWVAYSKWVMAFFVFHTVNEWRRLAQPTHVWGIFSDSCTTIKHPLLNQWSAVRGVYLSMCHSSTSNWRIKLLPESCWFLHHQAEQKRARARTRTRTHTQKHTHTPYVFIWPIILNIIPYIVLFFKYIYISTVTEIFFNGI